MQHQQEVAAAAGTKAFAAMRQLSVALPPLFPPELLYAPSVEAAHEVDAAIAAMLDMESGSSVAPQLAANAVLAASPKWEFVVPASPQSSAIASSPLAPSSTAAGTKEGVAALAEAGAESDDGSEASTVVCGSRIGHEALGCRANSSMWRLPSDGALLSFASCMAA